MARDRDSARGGAVDAGLAAVPNDARSVLVFGGTFDPPHWGHVVLPMMVQRALGLDWLLYVPAARSPHKESGPQASDADRVMMLEAAIGDEAWPAGFVRPADAARRASISTIEIDRASAKPGEASYTIDTLRALHDRLAMARRGTATAGGAAGASPVLRLLIGADQASAFHRWREPRAIIALAAPAVMLRRPAEDAAALLDTIRASAFWSEAELDAWRGRIVETPMFDADATSLRRELASAKGGAASTRVAACVSPSVLRLIHDRGLYRR